MSNVLKKPNASNMRNDVIRCMISSDIEREDACVSFTIPYIYMRIEFIIDGVVWVKVIEKTYIHLSNLITCLT